MQTHDALCMLPVNVINEKLYVFIWFWLLLLAILTCLNLTYRLVLLTNPATTSHVIKRRMRHKVTLSTIRIILLTFSNIAFDCSRAS